MQPLYRVKFTVDGQPFWVLRTSILAVRRMNNFEREQINPHTGQPYEAGDTDAISGATWVEAPQPTEVTVVVIGDGGGPVIVEESLDEALSRWDAIA